MKIKKSDKTGPASKTKVRCLITLDLPFDTYAKILKHGKRNEQSMEEIVRKLIEEHCE
jgi:hypothetical protein